MKKKAFIHRDEEGVSPVIATILMVAITVVLAAVLYIMVIGLTPDDQVIPIGRFGPPVVEGSTRVSINFAKINPEPKPVNLELVLVRNGTEEGKYSFDGNDDGELILKSGVDLGTLTYFDLADNQKVNIGDKIRMTNLAPNSEHVLSMVWVPTGDEVTSSTFRTPAA